MEQLLTRIESLDYQIPFAIHSGVADFMEAIESSSEFVALKSFLAEKENRSLLLSRAREILANGADRDVRSDKDTALGVYALALASTPDGIGRALVSEIRESDRMLWWARRIAERIAVRSTFSVNYSVLLQSQSVDVMERDSVLVQHMEFPRASKSGDRIFPRTIDSSTHISSRTVTGFKIVQSRRVRSKSLVTPVDLRLVS